MPELIDMTGKRFVRWTVLGRAKTETAGHPYWRCRCDCGNESVVQGKSLRRGDSTSCGCYRSEFTRDKNTTHGMRHTSTYKIWAGMLDRCRNPNHKFFKDYGGRGIKVCERWYRFENFLADMGVRPNELTLDRFPDKNGNYEKSNCRWATQLEQNNNARSNHLLTFHDRTQSISQWSRELGLTRQTVQKRLKLGWSLQAALTTPPR